MIIGSEAVVYCSINYVFIEGFPNSIFARVGAYIPLRSSKSDIELSVFHISCFISVRPFVDLSKATFAEKSHLVLSSPY